MNSSNHLGPKIFKPRKIGDFCLISTYLHKLYMDCVTVPNVNPTEYLSVTQNLVKDGWYNLATKFDDGEQNLES